MKAKTIKKVINSRVKAWLESITDEVLRKDASENVIVTGGCIVSMLQRENVNDFDIYFRTFDVTKRIAEYYTKIFCKGDEERVTVKANQDTGRIKMFIKSVGVSGVQPKEETLGEELLTEMDEVKAATVDDTAPKYQPVFISANAITLSNKVQIIVRFWGEPAEIHTNYDFVHCMMYWTSWDDNLVLPQAALEAVITKELRYVGSLYPICSVIRLRKFISRGWSINAGQILKMCMQISKLDLTSINVLEDQLTGVDAAYFMQIIYMLQKKQEETGESKIDATYVATLIDRIF